MRRDSRYGRAVTYSKVGLMQLNKHFEQRKIDATYGSFRGRVSLRTPSGPQDTESELETMLLIQLAFVPGVYDLMTQPIIRYTRDGKPLSYTPDVIVQLGAGMQGYPCRYLIEAKTLAMREVKKAELAEKFAVGRLCEDVIGAAFRILSEPDITTPYYHNAKMLGRRLLSDREDPSMYDVVDAVQGQAMTVTETIAKLVQKGFVPMVGREMVEAAVAHRHVRCDLSSLFTDDTILRPRPSMSVADQDEDPFLAILRTAENK